MSRKICVVTGTRAEYGLLKRTIKRILSDPCLELQLVVTGMHLSNEFGYTIQEIKNDNIPICAEVEILLTGDTRVSTAKSVALGILEFCTLFDRLQPDIILILGDRYEILAVAQTALILNIPIAHISGGELTEGAIDDAIRHSITKMSHIHFPANDEYKSRIIQLGEQPQYVFNVGDPGVENVEKMDFLSKKELESFFDLSLDNNLLITYHPATLEIDSNIKHLKELFKALDYFKDYTIIFTKGNADPQGRIINQLIEEYASNFPKRVKVYSSLGLVKYLSTMKYSKAVLGNSSSGIIEAPILKIPTVNIGNRQTGRAKSKTIIDCNPDVNSIREAILKVVNPQFIDDLKEVDFKYHGGQTSEEIVKILKTIDLNGIIQKKFYNLGEIS